MTVGRIITPDGVEEVSEKEFLARAFGITPEWREEQRLRAEHDQIMKSGDEAAIKAHLDDVWKRSIADVHAFAERWRKDHEILSLEVKDLGDGRHQVAA